MELTMDEEEALRRIQDDSRYVSRCLVKDGMSIHASHRGSGEAPYDEEEAFLRDTFVNRADDKSIILFELIHDVLGREKSMAFWKNLAVHKDTVSDRLGRPISIEVALLDYLDSRVDDACSIRRIRRLCESVFARLSYYDRLSGMHDPQCFKKLLDIESRKLADHGASYSIVAIDITFLRIINDQEGFEVGDKVIADVGAIIADSLRDIDICSRIGGDEFLIVLPYATLDEASAVSRSIYDGVASYSATEFGGKDHSVSITYGVASSSHGDTGLEAAIERASVDLYAKRNCAARREV